MLKKTSLLRPIPGGEVVEINLPRPELTGFDFSAPEDRETAARLLEAMGLQAAFTAWKMLEVMNRKLETENEKDMKIPDLGKAIQSISTAASINFEKAGLIRAGVENIGKEVDPEEYKKPEYLRALETAAEVLRKAG